MKEKRRVLYKKGVFVCPQCRQSYVQEKWLEEWRIRCHKCDYRGTLTEVSVEEHMDEETVRHERPCCAPPRHSRSSTTFPACSGPRFPLSSPCTSP